MDAFTPNTSKDYIVDKDPHHPENEGTLCCFRSHVAALEWFARASDKEYVIIIEDDIALLKENFVNRVNETIILWGKHKRDIDYVTLAYPKTLDYRGSKNDGILSWDFDKEHIMWGALVQMFPKEIAKTITQLLHKSTTKEVRGSIYNAVMSSSIKINQLRYPRLQTDALFPVFFKQAIIYPTCGMEVKFKSVISNNMNTNIWEESIRTNRLDPYLFWSDPTKGSQDQLSKSSRKTSNVFQSSFNAVRSRADDGDIVCLGVNELGKQLAGFFRQGKEIRRLQMPGLGFE